jgi:hypothetical protein
MSNQEPQNPNKTTEDAAVKNRRRFIKGAGVATPVVLTLSSPSVFGALCASEIASGNQSHTGTGSCTLGLSPAILGDPSHKNEWDGSGFSYGKLIKKGDANKWRDYQNGTKFKAAFGGRDKDDTTLLEHLHAGSINNPSLKACLSAALLNAAKSKSYPLTVDGVKAIQAKKSGSLPTKPGQVPSDSDVIAYLQTTW